MKTPKLRLFGYSRKPHKRTCVYKNLEAEISSFDPLNKKPKEAEMGNGSYKMGFMLFSFIIQEQKL